MKELIIKQLEELNPSEQELVAQFVRGLLSNRLKSEVSADERKRRLRASFGTVSSPAVPPDESLRREYLYGEDGR